MTLDSIGVSGEGVIFPTGFSEDRGRWAGVRLQVPNLKIKRLVCLEVPDEWLSFPPAQVQSARDRSALLVISPSSSHANIDKISLLSLMTNVRLLLCRGPRARIRAELTAVNFIL